MHGARPPWAHPMQLRVLSMQQCSDNFRIGPVGTPCLPAELLCHWKDREGHNNLILQGTRCAAMQLPVIALGQGSHTQQQGVGTALGVVRLEGREGMKVLRRCSTGLAKPPCKVVAVFSSFQPAPSCPCSPYWIVQTQQRLRLSLRL
jgi:hypothetical protein